MFLQPLQSHLAHLPLLSLLLGSATHKVVQSENVYSCDALSHDTVNSVAGIIALFLYAGHAL